MEQILKVFRKESNIHECLLHKLTNDTEYYLNTIEYTGNPKTDLITYVNLFFELKTIDQNYRQEISEECKVKRTFYVDEVNRLYYKMKKYLLFFDTRLKVDLEIYNDHSPKELILNKIIYFSMHYRDFNTQKYFDRFLKAHADEIYWPMHNAGWMIESISDNGQWPVLSGTFSSHIFIGDSTNVSEVISDLKDVSGRHITPSISADDHSNKEILWDEFGELLITFFRLNLFQEEKIKTEELTDILIPYLKDREKTITQRPESIDLFFKKRINRRWFLLFLYTITNTKSDRVIPISKHKEFRDNWCRAMKIKGMSKDRINDFMGNKESRKSFINLNGFYEDVKKTEGDIDFDLRRLNQDVGTSKEIREFLSNALKLVKESIDLNKI